MQKTTMKNDTLEMDLERTFEFPYSKYSVKVGSEYEYIKIYELSTGRTFLLVPLTTLNYISVEEVEEEENDPEIQE